MSKYIGASVKRKEDGRFITGRGRYTDDIVLPNMTHAYIVRSPHAHAKIKSINVDQAKAQPGVVAIFTGKDMEADGVGSVPNGWQIGEDMKEPPHPPLAVGKVRHVGDGVAIVIAEDRYAAKDAAELVEVDYEILPAVTDGKKAIETGAPALHDEAPDNVSFVWELGDKDAADNALKNPHHTTKLEIVNQRLIANAIEPRSAIGDYDAGRDELTLYTSSQNPHLIRLLMCAFVLGIPEHKVRIISPDVGGGFGSKIFHYPEEIIMSWATRKIGRPIKWTAERSESYLTDAHGRDHHTTAEMGFDKDGNILGLRVNTVANLGAYLSTLAGGIPTWLYGTLLAGQYKTKSIYVQVTGVFTNTTPVDAYRGAGRPEATYVIERLMDTAAREMNMDPAELRRKNFIAPDAFPYQTPVVMQYDSGNYEPALDKALQMINYKKLREEQKKARDQGRLLGIGFSAYIEACGIAPSKVAGAIGLRAGLYEGASVRVHPTGKVMVYTGSHSHGQGHETTFAQVAADGFGISIDDVEVVHGDTAQIPFGMGTYGSRSIAVGGNAIYKAIEKIKEKAKKIAAHKLEASADDLEFADGSWTVKGTDKSVTFADVALTAYVPHDYPEDLEPGLEDNAFWDPKNFTFPFGTHICSVEIDPDTGKVKILKYVAVDDVGNVINPMIVDGQLHGGIAQGAGQVLWEEAVYDDSGQLLTGTMMDYAIPKADDLPSFEIDRTTTPCPDNPLGVKGAGEAGTIASTACIANAVIDAVAHLGVKDLQMPFTPQRVWNAIHGNGNR
ncbi:xanthine dehydrogenase family protein molybdopterin-binding subunit [candidate division KSB1 bacterium]|nr:xanthine dehydrogenase family protein molybdopterin-binding subunit [candidate division KSB1 bacterium]